MKKEYAGKKVLFAPIECANETKWAIKVSKYTNYIEKKKVDHFVHITHNACDEFMYEMLV